MAKERSKTKVKGTARIKKFNADQDETTEEPTEVIEREFELTEEQVEQIKQGKKVEIVEEKPKVKQE